MGQQWGRGYRRGSWAARGFYGLNDVLGSGLGCEVKVAVVKGLRSQLLRTTLHTISIGELYSKLFCELKFSKRA